MLEINLNHQFAELLKNHGIAVTVGEEFIFTDLPDHTKFKVKASYEELNDSINSRFDMMAITHKGEQILEACDDIGDNVEDAINRNFQNFCSSTFHPLIVALGCTNPHAYEQITIEEWEINDRKWQVYMGNLQQKYMHKGAHFRLTPPPQFFENIEQSIKSQKPSNRLHWFRSYYSQHENEITNVEFMMDNELLPDGQLMFGSLPIMPKLAFYSCRNFIVIKSEE